MDAELKKYVFFCNMSKLYAQNVEFLCWCFAKCCSRVCISCGCLYSLPVYYLIVPTCLFSACVYLFIFCLCLPVCSLLVSTCLFSTCTCIFILFLCPQCLFFTCTCIFILYLYPPVYYLLVPVCLLSTYLYCRKLTWFGSRFRDLCLCLLGSMCCL